MSNISGCGCCEFPELNRTEKIVVSTWYGIAGLAAIIGNAVVLWLIARNRPLRTISNLFLTSLAVADLLVGLVMVPVWIPIRCLYSDHEDLHNYNLTIDYLWIHTTVATTFNLCCVTLDRNIAIFHPLRHHDILTKRRCYATIATVWIMSLVLPCSRFFVKEKSAISALWMSFTVITVLIPMVVIVFSCIRILKAATEQSKRIVATKNADLPQNQDNIKRGKKNYKAAKTVSIVVGLFVICWLPSLVTSLVDYFTQTKHCGVFYYYNTLWTWVEAAAFTSSGINPWVYCLRNEEFYEALTLSFPFFKRKTGANHNRFCLRDNPVTN